jgi:hypothetical protein
MFDLSPGLSFVPGLSDASAAKFLAMGAWVRSQFKPVIRTLPRLFLIQNLKLSHVTKSLTFSLATSFTSDAGS